MFSSFQNHYGPCRHRKGFYICQSLLPVLRHKAVLLRRIHHFIPDASCQIDRKGKLLFLPVKIPGNVNKSFLSGILTGIQTAYMAIGMIEVPVPRL